MKPLHDRVLIERIEIPTKTAGGIILLNKGKEKPPEGRVIAVGEGLLNKAGERIPLDVKEGDHVLFEKWTEKEIRINGKEVIVLREADIIAIINEE